MTPSGIEPATFRFVAKHLNGPRTAILASLFTTAPPNKNLKHHTSPKSTNGSVRNLTLLHSVCSAEHTMTGVLCLTEWLLPHLIQDRKIFILQQDGAPTHFHVHVTTGCGRQPGSATYDGSAWLRWSPR